MIKICIDAGHGGVQPGACNGSRKEKDDVLKLAIKVEKLLTLGGVKVIMTRTTDKDVEIMDRCAIANKAKCDYFLSIHRDSATASAKGASIYVYTGASNTSIKRATAICNAVVKAGGFNNRGLHKGAPNYDNFGVNRYTNMNSALLEVGFISNADDNKRYDKYIDNIAKGIAQALFNAFGVNANAATIAVNQKKSYSGTYPTLPARGYFKNGDSGTQVRYLQKLLVWCGYKVDVDGDIGSKTVAAVKAFQKANKLTVDGLFGKASLAAAKKIKK